MRKLPYLDVRNVSAEKADLYFYGEIVGDEWSKWCDTDTCPNDVLDALKETEGKELNIYINSPGGNVFAGIAIYNILMRKPEKKTVQVDSLAASMGSVLAMVGDGPILMPSNAFLMIHPPSSFVWGTGTDMRKAAEDLDLIQTALEQAYLRKLKNPEDMDKIRELIADETWMTAAQAAEYFDVTILPANQAVASIAGDVSKHWQRMPEALMPPKEPPVDPAKEAAALQETERLRMELELLDL